MREAGSMPLPNRPRAPGPPLRSLCELSVNVGRKSGGSRLYRVRGRRGSLPRFVLSCFASLCLALPCLEIANRIQTRRNENQMATMKNTKTNQSKKSSTPTTQTKQAPAPAASAVNSTAEQAPAPQANQASQPSTITPNTATPMPLITGPANGSNNGTKISLQTSYAALIAGLHAFYQPGDVLQLPAGNETRDDVIADLQKFVQATEDTKAAYLAWRAAVQNERTIELALRPEKQAVQSVVVGRF